MLEFFQTEEEIQPIHCLHAFLSWIFSLKTFTSASCQNIPLRSEPAPVRSESMTIKIFSPYMGPKTEKKAVSLEVFLVLERALQLS